MRPDQLSLLLAVVTAAMAGTSDYLAGREARGASAMSVTAWVQFFGLPVIGVALISTGWATPRLEDVGISTLAGLLIAIGLGALYRSLALGPISVTAPVAAVLGAAVPVLAGVLLGERLAVSQMVGLLLGLAAVTLLASAPRRFPEHRVRILAIGLAALAGAGIGGFSIALKVNRLNAGLWPLLISRGVAAGALWLVVLRNRRTPSITTRSTSTWRWLAVAGVLDSTATITFLIALRTGRLSLVVVIAAFYPAVTVALATLVDRQPLRRLQIIGLLVALTAMVLISMPASTPLATKHLPRLAGRTTL